MKKYFNPSNLLRHSSVLLALFAALTFFTHSSVAQVRVGINVDVQNYVPPSWAPPYDNVSAIRYYYLPDYDMYYDVWTGQFWYAGPQGEWIASEGPPPQYANVDFGGAFIVLIDRNIARPWMNHSYYHRNYPEHGYDNYRDIVVRNRIVTNTEPGHELVPRAFNENTNRVTFMQRRVQQAPAVPNQRQPNNYHRVVHEVPIKTIAPSMPAASRNFNYGRGYVKPAPTSHSGGNAGAPGRGAGAPNRGAGAPIGGGSGPKGGGGPNGGRGRK